MAGCAGPELPIVLAALEAACREEFALHGLIATTAPAGPVVIVSGPYAQRARHERRDQRARSGQPRQLARSAGRCADDPQPGRRPPRARGPRRPRLSRARSAWPSPSAWTRPHPGRARPRPARAGAGRDRRDRVRRRGAAAGRRSARARARGAGGGAGPRARARRLARASGWPGTGCSSSAPSTAGSSGRRAGRASACRRSCSRAAHARAGDLVRGAAGSPRAWPRSG